MTNARSPHRISTGDQLQESALELSDRPVGLQQLRNDKTGLSSGRGVALHSAAQAPAPEAERRAYGQILRTFFRTGKGGGWPKGKGITSALLAPYTDNGALESAFPLWMPNVETWLKTGTQAVHKAQDASTLLKETVSAFALEGEDSYVLHTHLPRLQRIVYQALKGSITSVAAPGLWKSATEELQKELQLKGVEALLLTGALNQLLKHLPPGGVLVPFSQHTPLLLLSAYLEYDLGQRAEQISMLLEDVLPRLRNVLAVEKEKQPEASAPDQLRQELDFAAHFMNFEALSKVLPTAEAGNGNVRYARLATALETLERTSVQMKSPSAHLVISSDLAESMGLDLEQVSPGASIQSVGSAAVFTSARARFDTAMADAASFWKALRIARLEFENQYQEALHDDFFAQFTWQVFTDEEMALCPPVVALVQVDTLVQEALPACSAFFAQNVPIKVVALPGAAISTQAHQLEPTAFAIAHRNAFVLQTSAVAPGVLLYGLRQGLQCNAPAFFNLLGMGGVGDQAYLNTLAAVESRIFPGVSYDPSMGPQWGSRFSLLQNPDAESDWPKHLLEYKREKELVQESSVAFTFADFVCGLKPFEGFFHIVPPAYWGASLIPLGDFLSLSPEDRIAKVPFIWVADRDNEVHKAAVAAPLVQLAEQRLDFWKYLQEQAGIHNYHVERAAEQLAQELESNFHQRVDTLHGVHQSDLDRVREDAARDTMERLAAVLLDLDIEGIGVTPKPTATAAPVAKPAPAPEALHTEPVEATPITPAEAPKPAAPIASGPIEIAAWIDTPLCTSCSECVDAEPAIFQYNEDKQAFVSNPRGGSFADLVKAAERCPVSIIHPGTPWDKDDPDLHELLERARPFE